MNFLMFEVVIWEEIVIHELFSDQRNIGLKMYKCKYVEAISFVVKF